VVQYSEHFGFSASELASLQSVFRPSLFQGEVALVSGAATGIGKALATIFARLGARLVICGRDVDRLTQAQSDLEALGAEVLAVPMTIRDPEQVQALFAAAKQRFGGIDHLVNNAGGHFAQPAIDYSVKGWQAVIDTNLSGTWFMMQEAARGWVGAGKPGSIVNVTLDVWRGIPGIAHTCAARAGVIFLSRTLAVEWAEHRIRVNCVAPGLIETSGFNQYSPEHRKRFDQANPMLTMGNALDVAQACLYLSAPSGRFITGETLTVDGGQQLWGDLWPAGRPEYFRPRD